VETLSPNSERIDLASLDAEKRLGTDMENIGKCNIKTFMNRTVPDG
jgi:hypothetical protein